MAHQSFTSCANCIFSNNLHSSTSALHLQVFHLQMPAKCSFVYWRCDILTDFPHQALPLSVFLKRISGLSQTFSVHKYKVRKEENFSHHGYLTFTVSQILSFSSSKDECVIKSDRISWCCSPSHMRTGDSNIRRSGGPCLH